jgi:deoxyribose-phosphate aldolase
MLVPRNTRDLRPLADLALVEPAATRAAIEKLCLTAIEHSVHGVCVNGSNIVQAYALVSEHNVKVIATVGYPLGAMDGDAKRYETEIAVDSDAHEIEVVLNLARLKEGDHGYVLRELRDICEAADERPVNVILEADMLTADEQKIACDLIIDSGARAVCTHTGFFGRPAAPLIRRLRGYLGAKFLLKANPVADLNMALEIIESGANRVGLVSGAMPMAEMMKK